MPVDPRTARLARRYRRWLWAYPPAYRRERGPELLATLLDSTAPGRSGPPAREITALLRHGLGHRVAGIGRRAYVIAAFAAVLGALSGIALGSWLAWRTVDPLAPDTATATALARTVLPVPLEGPADHYGRHTFWNPNSNNSWHGGTGLRAGRAVLSGAVPTGADYRQLAAAVEQRLRGQGWHDVHTVVDRYPANTSPPAQAEVTGTRDGYLTAVQINPGDGYNPAALTFSLMRAEPAGHLRDTIAGGLAGALLGALLGLFTAQRMRRHSPGRQRVYSVLCFVTLVLLAPACLGNIPTTTGSLLASTTRDSAGPAVYWGGFVFFGAQPLAVLSLIPLLAILITCAWPRLAPASGPAPTMRQIPM